ncbi:MAG: tRNA (adenosine(37)-N6)-dimethylallyltransferase MiaA, partial [Moraxella sp.]|nr:tRNA (adenosine(37)-N6)-dimethylallyltransferase MiaA [Moraxella sp.]
MLYYKNLPSNAVINLIAPTASGKTDLAYRLYETGRFELISVDSALIYRGMDIGTAKPSANELLQYPHHLVDIVSPTDTFNVSDFVGSVRSLIDEIHAKGKLPLLVGGTMMYYMALLDGLSTVPQTDEAVRTSVMNELKADGVAQLYKELQVIDPVICQRLKVSDTQRITRAIEVYRQTGTPLSVWQATPKTALANNPNQAWHALLVMPDRAWLHERIALRLEMMWQAGFVDEVIALLQKYPNLSLAMPSMRCVGYRQVLEYLLATEHELVRQHAVWEEYLQNIHNNDEVEQQNTSALTNISHEMACQDMKNKALYATRQLAKRQYTWLRQLLRLNDSVQMIAGQSHKQLSEKA